MLTWTQLLPLVCWGSPLLFTKGTCSPSPWPATSGSSMESTLPLFPASFLSSFAIRRQGSSQDVTPLNSSESRPWTTPYPFSLTSTKKPLGASHHALLFACSCTHTHTHTLTLKPPVQWDGADTRPGRDAAVTIVSPCIGIHSSLHTAKCM